MKRLIMVLIIGLSLAATGFAQAPGAARSGGGSFSYNGHEFSGHFSGVTARGRFEGGFAGYRGGFVGTRFGFGFAYAPGPVVAGCGYPCYACPGCAPACCPPAYYPGPVVGVGVVRGGFVRGPAFAGRGFEWRQFARR